MFDNLTSSQATQIFQKYGVTRAAIFGSYAKGEEKATSDVDLLVQFEKGQTPSYFKMFDFEEELAGRLNKKVDIVTFNGLHQFIKEEVLKTMQIIYEK